MGDDEVSGDPHKMLTYAGDALEQVDDWRGKVSDLEEWLPKLREALQGLPDGVMTYIPNYETQLGERVQEQEHLEGFVRNVAHGLMRANGYDYYIEGDEREPGRHRDWPPGVLTADESDFDPGRADRDADLADQATEDARTLVDLVDASGIRDARNDVGLILPLDDPRHDDIVALLERTGDAMDDPAYAQAYYEALGADGIELLGGLLYQFSYDSMDEIRGRGWDSKDPADYPSRQLGDPLIAGFAGVSGRLPEKLRTALFDIGLNDRDKAVAVAVMMSAEGPHYDPVFAADAAEALVFSNGGSSFYMEQAIAMRLLAEDPQAAWHYASRGDRHLVELLYTPRIVDFGSEGPLHTHVWLNTTPDEARGLYDLWSATAYLHATGIPVRFQDREGDVVEFGWRDWTSMGADIVPFVGTGKAWAEVTTSHDPITGDEVNPYVAGAGLIPFVGIFKSFGRGLKKLFRGRPRHLDPSVPRATPDPPGRQSRADLDGHGALGSDVRPLPVHRDYDHAAQVRGFQDDLWENHGIRWDPTAPPRPGSADFDALVDISGGNMKYVVLEDGSMVLAPRDLVSHGALSWGPPNHGVVAAGDVKITGTSSTGYTASEINNMTGHYGTPGEGWRLDGVAIPSFHAEGIPVTSYDPDTNNIFR